MPTPAPQNLELQELQETYRLFSNNKVFIFGDGEITEAILKEKIGILKESSESASASVAGAGAVADIAANNKKAFITNSGAHWTVYTTEDGGNNFKKVKIRGDGYCGLTASLYVYDFFQENANKLNLLSQLQTGETILSPSGGEDHTRIKVDSDSDLEGQYYITSTFESGERVKQISNDDITKINQKIPTDTNLQERIQKLSNSRGEEGNWLEQEDVYSFLNQGSLTNKVREEASNGDEIAPLRNTLAMLKSKKARAEFIKKINNEGANFTIEGNFNIEDLFPSLEVQNLATDQNFQQKYLPIFEKLCEKKDSLGNKIDDLATKIFEFIEIVDDATKAFLNILVDRLFPTNSPAPTTPAAPTITATTRTRDQAQKQAEKNIAETKYEELNKPRNLYEFVKKYCGQIDFNAEEKGARQERVKETLKEKIPDTFQPIPKNKYAGWGLKIEYSKDQIKIVEDFDKTRASNESTTLKNKIITHIDGKPIAEFIQDQKSYSTIQKGGLRQDDIPDEYYLTHFFRTAKSDIKLKFNDNNEQTLSQNDKKIYQKQTNAETYNCENPSLTKEAMEKEIREITIDRFKSPKNTLTSPTTARFSDNEAVR